MGDKSKIGWTDATWNPVTGCSKVSAGCKNCYAERMAHRLQAMGQANYRDGFEVRCHTHMLSVPSKWKRPRMVFVCSMGDLFHRDVPASFISRVFVEMNSAKQHTFQILTKRPLRMARMSDEKRIVFTPNIWCGTTVENQDFYGERVDALTRVRAKVRFLSIEPMVGPVQIGSRHFSRLDWIILGCESGPHARPMNPDWARQVRDQCRAYCAPFFLKQMVVDGKLDKKPLLDGKLWQEMPT